MKRLAVLASAAVVMGAAPASPPPVAQYWMDAATASGMGAAFMGGGRPSPAQIMQMMQGGGSQVGHTLNLYLASRKSAPAPEANHFIPPAMQMGPSLPLIAPAAAKPESAPTGMPPNFHQPRGRMLIYWGCGEHAGAGQPTVLDFSKITSGHMPPGFAAMASAVRAAQPPRPGQSAGYGEWPNDKNSRPVPATASLVGSHRVEGNYSPPIAFSIGQGQDFMPGLGLRQGGSLPSGAVALDWNPAPQATGYALAMFGSSGGNDMVMWTSGDKPAVFPNMDYLSPAQVKPLVASGAVLAPSTSRCTLPAEVVRASPHGMVMMIGYGPEGFYSDKPKAPTWTVRTRYKTTATLMMGMGGMGSMGEDSDEQSSLQQPPPQQQQPKKRKGFGLGDLLGTIPH